MTTYRFRGTVVRIREVRKDDEMPAYAVTKQEMGYHLLGAYMYLMLDEDLRCDGRPKKRWLPNRFRERIQEVIDKYGYQEQLEAGELPNNPDFIQEIDTVCICYSAMHRRV